MLYYINNTLNLGGVNTQEISTSELTYKEKLSNLEIVYLNDTYKLTEFYTIYYKNNMDTKTLQLFNETIKPLIPLALELLKEKKNKFLINYQIKMECNY